MSLRGAATRLNSTTRALKNVNVRSLTDELGKELGSTEKLAQELPKIYKRAAASLVPIVRRILASNYRASGIGRESGELWQKSVAAATVRVNNRGTLIVIEMGSGGDKSVYARAGAFRFGAVRNTQFKSTFVDLSTGATKTYKGGKGGVIGARAKRSIKKAVLGGGALSARQSKATDAISKSVIVTRPKSPFFTIDNGADEIERAFVEAVQKEIKAYMKTKTRRAA